MEEEADIIAVTIPVQVFDTPGVKRGRPADDPVYDVSLIEEELRKITAVLS
jgi:hypothetical protein